MCRLNCLLLLTTTVMWLVSDCTEACPFCSPVSQTFSQELASADVMAIVTLKKTSPPRDLETLSQSTSDPTRSVPKAVFEIQQTMKGADLLQDIQEIEAVYFGDAEIGTMFMITALGAPDLDWTTPLRISERVRDYLTRVAQLATEPGSQQLEFYLEYLEDEEDLLARDAYDEFARASYDEVKALRDRMNRELLISWIEDIQRPPSRRRLYLTMLGVCGQPEDAAMLETMIRSEDRKTKAALDATIACYLTLIGVDGLSLIEDHLLKNQDADYTDTYAAIMALRFHADQGNPIQPQRAVESLRYMLDRPELADLVVPDLARWEDWESMPRLIQLFKDSTDENSWVRVPVINYLRRCPLPEAATAILELEKLDPDAVRRARTFFPTSPPVAEKAAPELADNQVNVADDTSIQVASLDNVTVEKTDDAVPGPAQEDEAPEPSVAPQVVVQDDGVIEGESVAESSVQPQTESPSIDSEATIGESELASPAPVSRSMWTLGLSMAGLFVVVYAIKLTLT